MCVLEKWGLNSLEPLEKWGLNSLEPTVLCLWCVFPVLWEVKHDARFGDHFVGSVTFHLLGLSSNLGCSVVPEGSHLSPEQCQGVWQVSVSPGMQGPAFTCGLCACTSPGAAQVITTVSLLHLIVMDIIISKNTQLSSVGKVYFFSFGGGEKKIKFQPEKCNMPSLFNASQDRYHKITRNVNVSLCNEVTSITCMHIPVHWVFCWTQEQFWVLSRILRQGGELEMM